MKKILLATTMLLATVTASNAVIIDDFGIDPTSAAGAFSNDPNGPLVGGLFTDFYQFQLVNGPAFVSVITASNTFAIGGITGPFGIQSFAGAIFLDPDNVPNNGDETLAFGPQFASLCASGLCQELNADGIINPGNYYLQIQGDAGTLAGYGGNLSVAAVPGPIVGMGLPGILAMIGMGGYYWRRRRNAVA